MRKVIFGVLVFGATLCAGTPSDVAATGLFAVALDCDPSLAGVQATCQVPYGTVSRDVDLVVRNQTPSDYWSLAAFNFDAVTERTKLSALAGVDSGFDANPDFKISPTGTWDCTLPTPANDANAGSGPLDSFLSCYDAGDGAQLLAGQSIVVATVHYGVVASPNTTVTLELEDVNLADGSGVPLAACDASNEPPADCSGTSFSFGCSGDLDCDGFGDTPATLHQGPANTNTSVDNCPTVYNPTQTNIDGNYTNLHVSGKTYDDLTQANSDALGDACDSDKDNDGLSNTDESNLGPAGSSHGLCPTASAATDPAKADSDGDRVLDWAECRLGSDPANAASKPTAPPAGADPDADGLTTAFEQSIGTNPNVADTDGDGVSDGVEVMAYDTNPLSLNTDGDTCRDGKEIASINTDNTVNSTDIQQVTLAFGTAPGPPYIFDFDMNKDGVIDSVDQGFVSARFGACP